eukprot:5693299-Prymnesium_polylepis.1
MAATSNEGSEGGQGGIEAQLGALAAPILSAVRQLITRPPSASRAADSGAGGSGAGGDVCVDA